MGHMNRFYRVPEGSARHRFEECFYVESTEALTAEDMVKLRWLFEERGSLLSEETALTSNSDVKEIGPRLTIETPFSSNVVAICHSIGLHKVVRVERSRRAHVVNETYVDRFLSSMDVMTEEVYPRALQNFASGRTPDAVEHILILERGEEALREANRELGLGMDDRDISYYTAMFRRLNRNPTDVELLQLGNGNSEHSRHWFFRGAHVIDGVPMPQTLMEIVKKPLANDKGLSLVAFHDNAGVMHGTRTFMLRPARPGYPGPFEVVEILQHITSTAETHNHPTMIAPFPGAATGAGGRIRDNRAVGRGGLVHAGFAGYCVGNLHMENYHIPGEDDYRAAARAALPIDILIEGSNGVSRYGNEIGEPLIGGFCRSFGGDVGGSRREFLKPVLYSAGLGRVDDRHVKKHAPEVGMLIVRFGGPAYPIGEGGGAASSMAAGVNTAELDLKSVQRGNPEMENRANRVIQTCAEMGDENPIEAIHDQGAGGPSNVLTELLEPLGGIIDIGKIVLGDKTMSDRAIWVSEYQEGYGVLVRRQNIARFERICARERVNCEVLGEIVGDGNVVVHNSVRNTTPVNLALSDILSEMPQKTFVSERLLETFSPLTIPKGLTVEEALKQVLARLEVCSKGFLVHKADRSVTGLVARQQCVGPMQVPVANAAVTADSYFCVSGAAAAIGEQPIKMLINSKAGARMALAEMVLNLASVRVLSLGAIRCRANWMWAAKLKGQGPLLYDAALAMAESMEQLGIAIDGGKDSLSMAVQAATDLVVSPGELVIKGYARVPDVRKVVTPELKGNGVIGFIDLGLGKKRLGASSLAQSLGQLGNECPDIDAELLGRAFNAVQHLIDNRLLSAYHDRSDGGLITTLVEMCLAGNRGAYIRIKSEGNTLAELFNEEAGVVFECRHEHEKLVREVFEAYKLPYRNIGYSSKNTGGDLTVTSGKRELLRTPISDLRLWWEATSSRLDEEQASAETVAAERQSHADVSVPLYRLTFKPEAPALGGMRKPKVGILREEGVNGDREMTAACYTAGLDPIDVCMNDILDGQISSFDDFEGLIYPGGFSFADACGSAKGWAASVRFNPEVKAMFDSFYKRDDVFSLGVCNGCQFMSEIDVLPWQHIAERDKPKLLHNRSGRFESRWSRVLIKESPSPFFRKMAGSILGVWVAHGEGQWNIPNRNLAMQIEYNQLAPLVYVDPQGKQTEKYPYNPNGSPGGIAALCSWDGNHLAMMPHPERCFLPWQQPWTPPQWNLTEAGPWLQMFVNIKNWCIER